VIRDIVRIQIRQSITGPAAQAISGLDWGSLFGSLFGNSYSNLEPGYAMAPTGATGYGGAAGGYHTGGQVGRPPAFFRIVPSSAILDALPHRHGGGLAPNERLAVNKVGERYITEEQNAWLNSIATTLRRGSEDNLPEIKIANNLLVNVHNKNGSDVQVSETRETNQGLEIDVMIDNAVAKKAGTFGTSLNKTLRNNFGAKERLISR